MLAWKRKNVTLKIESDSSIRNLSSCTITHILKKVHKNRFTPFDGGYKVSETKTPHIKKEPYIVVGSRCIQFLRSPRFFQFYFF